MRAEEIKKKK